jgi:hypothetical protein
MSKNANENPNKRGVIKSNACFEVNENSLMVYGSNTYTVAKIEIIKIISSPRIKRVLFLFVI